MFISQQYCPHIFCITHFLLKRSNHSQQVEKVPPDSWWQIISEAIHFYRKHDKKNQGENKGYMVIKKILQFYQDHEIDTQYRKDLLLEYCALVM